MPALHYFHRYALEESGGSGSGRRDYQDALTQLANISRGDNFDSHSLGLLGASYAVKGERAEDRKTLRPRFLSALRALFDATPMNDHMGFRLLHEALTHSQDLPNAAAAWSLYSYGDIVSCALRFNEIDCGTLGEGNENYDAVGGGNVEQKALHIANQLGKDITKYVKDQIRDASEQVKRILLAKERIDYLMKGKFGKKEGGDTEDEPASKPSNKPTKDKAEIAAYCIVSQRLKDLHNRYAQAVPTAWVCDGRNPDGSQCTIASDFSREAYHCLFCWQIDFCRGCLDRLRSLP